MKTVIYNNIKGIVKGILPSCLFIFLPLTVEGERLCDGCCHGQAFGRCHR